MINKQRKISAYIIRNCGATTIYRNAYFQKSCDELNTVIDVLAHKKSTWGSFSKKIEKLLFYLRQARYYGRWSVGWDVARADGYYDIHEISIVDHIETFYSHVRSIHRLLRHENAVIRSHDSLHQAGKAMEDYANQLIESDESNMFILLKDLHDRVTSFVHVFSKLDCPPELLIEIEFKCPFD